MAVPQSPNHSITQSLAVALFAAAVLAACSDDGLPFERYEGPVPACEVEVTSGPATAEFEPARPSSAPEYWKRGPYGVWNTSPAQPCEQDPVMREVGDDRNVALYVTYPAASVPTVSGRGDVAPGRWPVIIFAHANSDRECNIYRRYYSLHDHWASWGFVVASVDGTHTNCRVGTKENIEERIAGQLAAVDKLSRLDADPDSRFFGRIDLSRVVFAGHSRGGGASLVAAERYGDAAGVIDLQGVDLTSFGFGSQTLPDYPVLGVTAGEDRDLDYPYVELTEDQLGGPYTWLTINGGIHAYTSDSAPIEPDDEPFISKSQQHAITEYYSTAFLARWVGVGDGSAPAEFAPQEAASDVLFSHQGARVVDRELSELGVYTRWLSPRDAIWLDHFDGDSPSTNLTGGQNVAQGFERAQEVATYRPNANPGGMYGKSRSLLLEADATSVYRVELEDEVASAGASIQARVKGPDNGPTAEFAVIVELDDGTTYRFEGDEHIGPEPLAERFTQLVVPGEEYAGASIAAVEFEVRDGALFVDDLRVVR